MSIKRLSRREFFGVAAGTPAAAVAGANAVRVAIQETVAAGIAAIAACGDEEPESTAPICEQLDDGMSVDELTDVKKEAREAMKKPDLRIVGRTEKHLELRVDNVGFLECTPNLAVNIDIEPIYDYSDNLQGAPNPNEDMISCGQYTSPDDFTTDEPDEENEDRGDDEANLPHIELPVTGSSGRPIGSFRQVRLKMTQIHLPTNQVLAIQRSDWVAIPGYETDN